MHEKKKTFIYRETIRILKNTYIFGYTAQHYLLGLLVMHACFYSWNLQFIYWSVINYWIIL